MLKKPRARKLFAVSANVLLCASLLYGAWRFWQAFSVLDAKASSDAAASLEARWEKKHYVLPVDAWQVRTDQSDVLVGNAYYLVENADNKFRCVLGLFELRFRSEDRFFFAGQRLSSRSKLDAYARVLGVPVRIEILDRRGFYSEERMLPCHQWIEGG